MEAEPLRVAFFGHGQGRRGDGLSTYSSQMVASLLAREVTVRFFAHREDGDILPVAPADAHVLSAWHFKTMTVPRPRTRAAILEDLRRFRPDVVHISWSFSLQDAAIARAAHRVGAACVATFHLPHGPAGTTRGRALQALYRYHSLQMHNVDRCIVLSEEQGDLLARAGYPPDRIVQIANAVDTDWFSPGPSPWREQLDAAAVVLYMGRLDPEKRVGDLVDAFLSLRLPEDHVLCIAGDGVQRERLRRVAAGRRNVRMLGLVSGDARRDLLRGCDVFVLPSTAEGLALSMLEAMACGAAVVATDAGEDGRALRDAGVVIAIHPLRPALDDALGTLLSDAELRRTVGDAARRRAVERYGARRNVDAVLAVYRQARARRGGGVRNSDRVALP